MSKVVTRIAPSPTGNLHIGTARSALFNFLFARQHDGQFILRIENTDVTRSTEAYEANILESLTWLGLTYDALYRQSERTDHYVAALEKLIANDTAYRSREPAKEDANREVEVVRLRNPGSKVTFTDMLRGEVTFDTAELGDFVIARSSTLPLYNLAVVVDDNEMGVTHVIRGEDHISNTPRQILIQRALGYEVPKYLHIPIILAKDRSKLSKRRGATAISEFREKGYLPEALINYLALLGWNPGTEQELFTLNELIRVFDCNQIQKGGAIFDEGKLRWFNREYLKRLTDAEFATYVEPHIPSRVRELPGFTSEVFERVLPVIRDRVSVGSDITEFALAGEFDYFFAAPASLNARILVGKGSDAKAVNAHISAISKLLEALTDFSAESVKEAVWHYAELHGKGAVLWPMRVALSGRERSPDPFTIASILGRTETLERLQHANSILSTV
jgi:glutamyl-tRNA synthetase